MKILGIDYGTKRIGLAISDESLTLARELGILAPKKFWQRLGVVIAENEIEKIILGWPLGMSGQVTAKTQEVEKFYLKLIKKVSLPVEKADERLSTVFASKQNYQNIDSAAAAVILQNYLNSL